MSPSERNTLLLHGFQDRPAGEVDLHGLYVKEAISYAEKAIKKARQRGDSEMCLIVGMRFPLISSFWSHGLYQARAIILMEAFLGLNLPCKRLCECEFRGETIGDDSFSILDAESTST